MKSYEDMTDEEFEAELDQIVRASRSEEEIRQQIKDTGCPDTPCLTSTGEGDLFMVMGMIYGPSGRVIYF